MSATDLTAVDQVSDIARNIAQVLAILFGAAWAYFKFLRGRTFSYRADVKINAALYTFDDDLSLLVTATVTNSGLSRIPLPSNQAMILANWLPTSRWGPGRADWQPVLLPDDDGSSELILPILEEHQRIEPGESVVDEVLLVLPIDEDLGPPLAFRVTVNVVSNRGLLRREHTLWSASTIVASSTLESLVEGEHYASERLCHGRIAESAGGPQTE